MKTILLFIFLSILTTTTKAQLWCTPNSVWHFDTSNPLWDTKYTKHTYLYDTLVGTTTFNKIKTETHGSNISGQINNYGYFYTSLQNDVIFFNSTNANISDSDTLIYFGPIGSKWRCWKSGGTSCSQSFIEIVDAGTSNIQGQNLIWRKVNYTNYYMFGTPNQTTQTGTDTIFERIGYKHLAFQFLGYCSDAPDLVPSSFRCFSDYQLSVNSTSLSCNYITGIFDNTITENHLVVIPNPAKHYVEIKSNEKIVTFKIIDVLGKVVLTAPFSNQIDISSLECGLFFITLESNSYKKTIKFIKE